MSVSINIVAKRTVSIFDTNITYNLAPFYNYDIKSILTHEQFEANAYTIEKER